MIFHTFLFFKNLKEITGNYGAWFVCYLLGQLMLWVFFACLCFVFGYLQDQHILYICFFCFSKDWYISYNEVLEK